VARRKAAATAAAAETATGPPPDFLGPGTALPANPARAGGPLVALLDGLAPAVDPLAEFWAAQSWAAQDRVAQGQRPLTYGRLLLAGDALLAAVSQMEEAATLYKGVLDRCSCLPPIPLPAVPLGY
jgi:hypothetical protein